MNNDDFLKIKYQTKSSENDPATTFFRCVCLSFSPSSLPRICVWYGISPPLLPFLSLSFSLSLSLLIYLPQLCPSHTSLHSLSVRGLLRRRAAARRRLHHWLPRKLSLLRPVWMVTPVRCTPTYDNALTSLCSASLIGLSPSGSMRDWACTLPMFFLWLFSDWLNTISFCCLS